MTSQYDLDKHEILLLHQAVWTADRLEELQLAVEVQGPYLDGPDEPKGLSTSLKPHPLLPEIRAQQLTLARLLVALRIPQGLDETAPTQYRGMRGVYAGGLKAVSE